MRHEYTQGIPGKLKVRVTFLFSNAVFNVRKIKAILMTKPAGNIVLVLFIVFMWSSTWLKNKQGKELD